MADGTQVKQDEETLDLLVSAPSEPPAPIKKVELDLDDAPFLQNDEKVPELDAPADGVPEQEESDGKKGKKKKLIIIGLIGLVISAIGAAAVWWFFFRTPPPPPPPGLEPEIIVVPKAAAPIGPSDIVGEFAPFIIPIREDNGSTGFLICKFSAITTDPGINREIDQQRLVLRDAIYFYLRGKDNKFLLNSHNAQQIKTELLSVFNDYLTQGKVEDILFESYLNH